MTDKPELKPSQQPRAFEPDPEQSRFKLIALIGFFILLVAIFVVVIFLPARLAKNKDRAQDLSQIESVKLKRGITEESEAKAKEAQELINKILKLQARLENDGVKIWGVEKLVTSYGNALALLAKADAALDGLLFDEALSGYREVIKKLKQLEASRLKRAQRAMKKGDEAFAQLDSESAVYHYKIAFAADRSSSEAQIRLQRAENLGKVLSLIAEGERYEKNGELALARQKYSEAVSLDKEFQLAQDHFQRVDALISDSDFLKFMSEAESAMKQEDAKRAKAALASAKNIKPDAPGVADLERQLNNIALYLDFQLLGRKALQHEMAEEWNMAAAIYNSILKKDANAGFAQEGKKRVENLLALIKEIQNYIINPDDLQEPEHISHARALYELAVSQSDAGPKFRGQIEQLNSLLTEYGRSVSVLVRSDNMTDVTVYRAGRLGQFGEHRLKLLPGRYKAIGSRSGYRDVSVPFTVPVGNGEVVINVFCKEKI